MKIVTVPGTALVKDDDVNSIKPSNPSEPEPWNSKKSKFCHTLKTRLEKKGLDPVGFHEFEWSKENTRRAREDGAKKFLNEVLDVYEAGKEPYIVIAHSHGGTVVIEALGKRGVVVDSGNLKGVVLMGTPFPNFSPQFFRSRVWGAPIWLVLSLGLLCVTASIWSCVIHWPITSHFWKWLSRRNIAILLSTLFIILIATGIFRNAGKRKQRTVARNRIHQMIEANLIRTFKHLDDEVIQNLRAMQATISDSALYQKGDLALKEKFELVVMGIADKLCPQSFRSWIAPIFLGAFFMLQIVFALGWLTADPQWQLVTEIAVGFFLSWLVANLGSRWELAKEHLKGLIVWRARLNFRKFFVGYLLGAEDDIDSFTSIDGGYTEAQSVDNVAEGYSKAMTEYCTLYAPHLLRQISGFGPVLRSRKIEQFEKEIVSSKAWIHNAYFDVEKAGEWIGDLISSERVALTSVTKPAPNKEEKHPTEFLPIGTG